MWKGWPVFDVRVCQYEKNSWLSDLPRLSSDSIERGKARFESRRKEVEKGLETIWNSVDASNNIQNDQAEVQ